MQSGLEELAEEITKQWAPLQKPAVPEHGNITGNPGATINVGGTQIVLNPPPPARLLTPEQRFRLNTLVKEISSEYGIDCRDLWRNEVHAAVGVSSVNEIPRDRFHDALRVLEVRERKEARTRATAHYLSTLNQRITSPSLKAKAQALSLAEYGHSNFEKLDIDGLKKLLNDLEDPPSALHLGVDNAFNGMFELHRVAIKWPLHSVILLLVTAMIGRYGF